MDQQINLLEIPLLTQCKKIVFVDGEVIFYPNFFDFQESNKFFQELETHINWRQDYIKFFGKNMPIPRLTAWYGDEGKSYIYSGIKNYPNAWNYTLKEIKNKIETVIKIKFNSVLLNFYRNGQDSMAWHSDDEPELGKNPIIASVSFGGTRKFCFKHKTDSTRKIDLHLPHGSLLLMGGETQHYWLHQVPKTKKVVKPRINLTFRVIY
jgi:alkylated DNA repair dioxygenase AlkB